MSNAGGPIASVANAGIQSAERIGTSRAIGWSRSKIKNTKKGTTITKESVEVQAWEIGVLAAGAAIYLYVTGGGSSSTPQSPNLPGWLQSLENWNQGGTLIKW